MSIIKQDYAFNDLPTGQFDEENSLIEIPLSSQVFLSACQVDKNHSAEDWKGTSE